VELGELAEPEELEELEELEEEPAVDLEAEQAEVRLVLLEAEHPVL